MTKNPRGFVIQSNKNPEIDATMESQVWKAAGPGAPGVRTMVNEVKIPALCLQRTQTQGRGTLGS